MGSTEDNKVNYSSKNVKLLSAGKMMKLMLMIFISLFSLFGILAVLNLTFYPELGILEIAREKTSEWRRAQKTDAGHEAIAFELMLDSYAAEGGDISHAMDTLINEFTPANWAELLEYDVDYFLKHEEINDSVKMRGMIHVTKTLYSSGHYDLFKVSYKSLVNSFAKTEDYPVIYTELLPMKANFSFDDKEEEEQLSRLYELELRRHLKLTAKEIVDGLQGNEISFKILSHFVDELYMTLSYDEFLKSKTDRFKVQLDSDLTSILSTIDSKAKESNNEQLTNSIYGLREILGNQGFGSFVLAPSEEGDQ
ncbi:MAG: hypothetical protein GY816_00495 [Cytophagales bacterium]|nr:hypothetical protein [Cytophagales bacterium]